MSKDRQGKKNTEKIVIRDIYLISIAVSIWY